MTSCSVDENGEEYTDEPCTICGDPFTYDTDKFMNCDECDVGFHQSCYGLEKEKMKANDCFTCYYCMQLNHMQLKHESCALCAVSKNDLALTTMDGNDGKWCHVICAYSFNCKSDTQQFRKVTINTEDMQCNTHGTCDICDQSKGYKLECVHPDCCNKIHPSCARINANNNDDSFYFDDIHNDTIYRSPLYFCAHHNIKPAHQEAIHERKQDALNMIQQWNQHTNKRKRKRETSAAHESPQAKKRKINRKYVMCCENEDSSCNGEADEDNVSEYSPTIDMESDDELIRTTSEESFIKNESSLPLHNRSAKLHLKRAKPKLSSYSGSKIANVHDFKYCMDKCYCTRCLKEQVIIKKEHVEDEDVKMENDEEEDEAKEWFNHHMWFNRNFTLREFTIKDKQMFTATFCNNINISTDYSTEYNTNDRDNEGNIQHTLNGYESVSMYNYSAIHNHVEDEIPIPVKPFRIVTKKKSTSKRTNKNKPKPASLFYRTIYRDIWLNCGGCVIAMDFNPICKYYNRNAFNYLAVFADCYNKYHVAPSSNTDTAHHKPYLIQIWKIKKRVSRKGKTQKRGWCKASAKHKNAVFHYGVVHEGGFIWDLQWLPFRITHKPSAGETADDQYQRLGVLAVCSEDTFVHIYSLPFVAKDGVLIDIKAVMKLSVGNETLIRLSWSSNLVYPMLLASSTNGCAVIWDLNALTQTLESNDKDVDTCMKDQQLNLIACHSPNETITALRWCSDHLKYFMTVSQNGCFRLWDVNHPFTPVMTRKLHSLSTDVEWIVGMDAALLTTESCGTSNEESVARSSTDCCAKFISIWPEQYLQNMNNKMYKKKGNSLSFPTLSREATRNYSRMGSAIQFPAERLYNVSDKVAFSVDVLLNCDCNNHDESSDALVPSESVTLYVVIGYSSGNVILYEHKLDELATITKKGNGQIMSQLQSMFGDKTNKCRFVGPFYGIKSNVYKNQFNVTRNAWTKQGEDKPIYDPFCMNPQQLALNDDVAIRKVKLCPNGDHLEVASASISGIIRIQTVHS